MSVDDFIREEAAQPFVWGRTDCASTADRWVRLATGRSPMAVYGRKHGNEEEARSWLLQPGGIAVAMNRVMRSAGFRRTVEPVPGDVGLVLLDPQTIAVAIRGGAMWFAHSEAGAHGLPVAHFWKAWKIA